MNRRTDEERGAFTSPTHGVNGQRDRGMVSENADRQINRFTLAGCDSMTAKGERWAQLPATLRFGLAWFGIRFDELDDASRDIYASGFLNTLKPR
jgi:hypothetical protein